MSNSEPYCELKKFIFEAKDEERNPYRKEDGYISMMISIGLMSGTSMDGIDAALINTDGHTAIQSLAQASLSYDLPSKILFKSAEYALQQHTGNVTAAKRDYLQALKDYLQAELKLAASELAAQIDELSLYMQTRGLSLNFDAIVQHTTLLHQALIEQLIQESGYNRAEIKVIGYHGQTLFHRPAIGITIQAGDGQLLANLTDIPVVYDFRTNDVKAGGQGAPFAPLYHQALAVRDQLLPVAVINCGGIANITVITGPTPHDLLGFDTGPGNVLIDRLVRLQTKGREHMDQNGHYGQQGQVNESVLATLYQKSCTVQGRYTYFDKAPPKSLDSGDLQLIPELLQLRVADACRTLEAFTADTIVNSMQQLPLIPAQWILAGGGWHNPVMVSELELRAAKLPFAVQILKAQEIGWNNQALEAEIFAYLAVRSVKGLPISYPQTTGVPEPLCGGQLAEPSTSGQNQTCFHSLQANKVPSALPGEPGTGDKKGPQLT